MVRHLVLAVLAVLALRKRNVAHKVLFDRIDAGLRPIQCRFEFLATGLDLGGQGIQCPISGIVRLTIADR
jgi:hypothetical protein